MKKILILGCSYSSGSWEPYLNQEEKILKRFTATSYGPTDKLIKNSKGWYHFVDYFKDKDVTVIPIHGEGYFTWYQVLLMLDETNKLNYDEIWIQETWEPRISFMEPKRLELGWNDPLYKREVEGIKFFDATGHFTGFWIRPHISDHKKQDTSEIFNDVFFNNIIQKITELIEELCIKKKIKGYVWSMGNTTLMKCEHFIKLPIKLSYNHKSIHGELRRLNLITTNSTEGAHQTEEGNKYIANLINEALKKVKYEKNISIRM